MDRSLNMTTDQLRDLRDAIAEPSARTIWEKRMPAPQQEQDSPFDADMPKQTTSWRVCPKCKSRATKVFSISTGKYRCQICDHEYDAPLNKTQ